MIVQRRVFYGKVGMADAIVKHLQDGARLFKGHGLDAKQRILTDHQSGRTDRVVWEIEGESLGAMDAAMGGLMSKPAAAKALGVWFPKLAEMITHAEVDHLAVR